MVESLTEAANKEDDKDYLSTLVGDGKKYANSEELARAYYNADLHIRELREDIDAQKARETSAQEVLEEIRKNKSTESAPPANNASEAPPITKDDIAEVVQSSLTMREQVAKAQANVDASLAKLDEVYGSREASLRAVRQVTGGNEELGKIVDELSRTDPDAMTVFVTAKVNPQSVQTNTPGNESGSGVRAGPELPEGVITWSKARELKKQDPAQYSSPEFRKTLERSVAYFEDKQQDYFAT